MSAAGYDWLKPVYESERWAGFYVYLGRYSLLLSKLAFAFDNWRNLMADAMVSKILKVVANPKKYVPLSLKILQQKLCCVFRETAFFMQGQMDINSKSRWHISEFVEKTGGYFPTGNTIRRRICDLESWDTTRRDMLLLLMRAVTEMQIEGDFAELGVYRGMTAKLIHHYAPERKLHLFDTFEGFGKRGAATEKKMSGKTVFAHEFSDTSFELIKKNISAINDNISYHKGYFPDSIPSNLKNLAFAFVHLDADLYEPTFEGLQFFYPRLSKRGCIVVHDYNAWLGARKAVDAFFADKAEVPVPMPDKSGSAVVFKQ